MDRSSVLFLILFMANAFRGRFLALFYEAHNLNDAQIGYILSVSSLVSLACSPLASKIADKYDSRALVTMVTYSFGIAVFLMQLIALPDIHVGLSQKGRFATLFVMRVFQAGFASPVYPLVCAMCIAALRKEFGPDGHTKFGQKRLWGAVGWAFSSLLLGFLLDQDGIGVWIVHVGYSVFGCLFLAVVYLSSGDERKRKVKRTSSWELIFPDHVEAGSDKAVEGGISATAVAKDINQQQQEISYVAVLHNLFSGDSIPEDSTMSVSAGMQSRARIMMFLVIQFTLAAVMSLVENLLFLFFKDDLHASYTVCGLSVVVTVIFEIPLFAFAPKLLKQIGAVNLLTIATMSFAVRAIGYTYSPNGYWVLLWEPLHGVTYACADTASVAFFAERMPKELEASGQALLGALKSTGMFVGTVVGGLVLETYGPTVLYRGAAILISSASLAFYLAESVEEACYRVGALCFDNLSTTKRKIELTTARDGKYRRVNMDEEDADEDAEEDAVGPDGEDLDVADILDEAVDS